MRGHAARAHIEGTARRPDSPPECALAATVLFVLAVVLTPKEAWWAFIVHAATLAAE